MDVHDDFTLIWIRGMFKSEEINCFDGPNGPLVVQHESQVFTGIKGRTL